MRIALDYDETFTKDPIFWGQMVELAKQRGHSVTFVTFRKVTPERPLFNKDIREDAQTLGIDIVFCEHKQKESQFQADIWIDDSPQFIPSADTLKKHCENFNVEHQLTYPILEVYDMKEGESYVGKVHADGHFDLYDMTGNPCPKKKNIIWRTR